MIQPEVFGRFSAENAIDHYLNERGKSSCASHLLVLESEMSMNDLMISLLHVLNSKTEDKTKYTLHAQVKPILSYIPNFFIKPHQDNTASSRTLPWHTIRLSPVCIFAIFLRLVPVDGIYINVHYRPALSAKVEIKAEGTKPDRKKPQNSSDCDAFLF